MFSVKIVVILSVWFRPLLLHHYSSCLLFLSSFSKQLYCYCCVFILFLASSLEKTVTEERCLAPLQEVTKSNENLGDNKSRGGEGQPERIAAKMLITILLCYLCYRRQT